MYARKHVSHRLLSGHHGETVDFEHEKPSEKSFEGF